MSRILKSNDTIITQNFKGVGVHGGVDVVGSNHSLCPVLAHSNGTVELVATGHSNNPNASGDATYGNFVKIKHSNNYSTLYAHLDKVYVSKGQTVTKGQEIGYMGNTGRSFGGHLHFEVRKDGSYNSIINPEPYINADLPGLTSNGLISQWQTVMNNIYHCNLAVDNSYGPDSKAKANQYQLHYTLPTIKNDYVRFVQQRLNDLGYKVVIDGSFGPDMNEKIRKFQQDRGLKVDGWVGKDTVEQLLK